MEVAAHLPQVATSGDRPDVGRVRDVVDAARDLGLAAVCANDHLTFHRPWLDGPTLLAAVADRAGGMDLALAGVPFDDRWQQFEESLHVLRGLLGAGPLPARWVEILDGSRTVEPPA